MCVSLRVHALVPKEYGAAANSAALVLKEQPQNEKVAYRLARAYVSEVVSACIM